MFGANTGLDALHLYQAGWDEGTRVFANWPKHDWTSHAADAFRYLALSWEEPEGADAAPKLPEGMGPDSINARRWLSMQALREEMRRPKTMDAVGGMSARSGRGR